MSSKEIDFAIVGATGAVGREMLEVMEQRQVPIRSLKLLASQRSAGETLSFGGKQILVEELTTESFKGISIALFSAGGDISKEFAPIAAKAGAIVVDNSSAFRMVNEVPLIVPEVNSNVLRSYLANLPNGSGGIIANPNCSTIQLVVVLKPLQDRAGLKRIIISTYQAVSGAGKIGIDELSEQTTALFNQKDVQIKKFAHRIAFNCLPHCDVFLDNGYTREEMKVVHESRKILGLPQLRVTATAVRVPVFNCHSESVNIELDRPLPSAEARELLRQAPGVMVLDSPDDNLYPMACDLSGTDATYVGRIRDDESIENGLNLWIVADNLRKGAALNAVQIAEVIVSERNECKAAA